MGRALVVLGVIVLCASACATARRPEPLVNVSRDTTVAEAKGREPASALPMTGRNGVDAWGFTVRSANRLALVQMLVDRRFEELTRVVEAFALAAEKDCTKELWAIDAFEAFSIADSALGQNFDDWVRASPSSFAPLVARGVFWTYRGSEARGGAWASETPPSQWAGMREAHAKAMQDFFASIALHPTIAAYRYLALIGTMGSMPVRRYIDLGLKICPASFQLYGKLVDSAVPRWGGSYEEMEALASSAPVEKNPQLRLLRGSVSMDKADIARSAKRPEEALAYDEEALKLGPYWVFELSKAMSLVDLRRPAEALRAVDLALEDRPQQPLLHLVRAKALGMLGRFVEATAAFLRANQLGPEQSELPVVKAWIVENLVHQAKYYQATDRARALRCIKKASLLDPYSTTVNGLWLQIEKSAGPLPGQ